MRPPLLTNRALEGLPFPVADVATLRRRGLVRARALGRDLLVVWNDGDPRLFEDACPHLGLPLHLGSLADGAITCRYHGWSFALDDGAVRAQPTLKRPSPCRLRRHGALRLGGLVFGWIGDPSAVDAARAQLPPELPERFALHRVVMDAPFYLALFNAIDYAHFARHSLYAPIYALYRRLRRDGHRPGDPFHWELVGEDLASVHLRLVEARRDLRLYATAAEFIDEGGVNRFQTFVTPLSPTRTEYWEVYSARTPHRAVRWLAEATFRAVVVPLLDSEDRDWTGRSAPNFLDGDNIHLSENDLPLGAHLRRFVLPRCDEADA